MTNSKAKGGRIERLVVQWFRDHKYLSARRTQQYNGTDGTSDVVVPDELPNLHIECKGTASAILQRSIIKKWIKQVTKDCLPGKTWIIFNQANHTDLIVIVSLDEFKRIQSSFDGLTMRVSSESSVNPSKIMQHVKEETSSLARFGMPVNTLARLGSVVFYEYQPDEVLAMLTAEDWCTMINSQWRLI